MYNCTCTLINCSGRKNQSFTEDHTTGFMIYLHERGQFWPGMEMERIGQTKPVFVPTNTEVWGSFSLVKNSNLAKDSLPCEKEPDFSFTLCIKQFVANSAGCHLDWVDKGCIIEFLNISIET